MIKTKTRPSGFRIFTDNFRWTWGHRKFQFKATLICTIVGMFLSAQVILSGEEQGIIGLIGSVVAIVGVIALWRDYREIQAEASEFSIAPLTRDTHELVVQMAKDYKFESGLFENRTILFPVDANRFIRTSKLDQISIEFDNEPFEIPLLENCRRSFENFRRQANVVWNDPKVRLNTDPHHFASLSGGIKLQRTSYFDYLATGFYSQRAWRFKNEVEYDGLEFMNDGECLTPLAESRTAHHIGVSTLLLTSNKRLLVQQTKAKGAVGRYVSSGSGSLDLADLDFGSFGKSLLHGALREFREETGWDELASCKPKMQTSDSMSHYPLGMALDASRGLITDFYFLSVADANTHLEYDRCYMAGKVIVDTFEIPTHNAITWLDCSDCDTLTAWKKKLDALVESYRQADPILAINLKLFGELLAEIEDQPEHGLRPTLLGNAHRVYLEM